MITLLAMSQVELDQPQTGTENIKFLGKFPYIFLEQMLNLNCKFPDLFSLMFT